MFDDGGRHRAAKHSAQPPVVVLGQHTLGLSFDQEETDVSRSFFLVLIVGGRFSQRDGMSDREHREGLCHLGMAAGEEPGHHRPPVVAGDMSAGSAKRLDDPGDVLDKRFEAVVLNATRAITQSVATHVRGHRQRSSLGQCIHLFGPRLGAFRKAVKEDEHVAARRAIDHRPKAQAVGLDHVLAGCHFTCLPMKSVATSSAWSRTARSPCPWPLKTSSRASGMSLIFSLKRSMRAKGSRSPLRNRVGQRI